MTQSNRDAVFAAILISAALTLLAPSAASAEPLWVGTFQFTVTELKTVSNAETLPWTVEGVSVGDTFTGYYTYLSPTADGTFIGDGHLFDGEIHDWGTIASFRVPILAPFDPGGTHPFYEMTSNDMGEGCEPVIMISGGQVTYFDWSVDIFGPVVSNFYGPQEVPSYMTNNTWNYLWSTSTGYNVAGGTLRFGDPQAVHVPEPSTLLLLCTGFGTLVLRRYRSQRQHRR